MEEKGERVVVSKESVCRQYLGKYVQLKVGNKHETIYTTPTCNLLSTTFFHVVHKLRIWLHGPLNFIGTKYPNLKVHCRLFLNASFRFGFSFRTYPFQRCKDYILCINKYMLFSYIIAYAKFYVVELWLMNCRKFCDGAYILKIDIFVLLFNWSSMHDIRYIHFY